MSAFASHVSYGNYHVGWQFLLDVEVPLLHVRPYGLIWNCIDRKREYRHCACTGANACVTAVGTTGARAHASGDVRLRSPHYEGRRTFQRFRIGFVAIGVFEENTVAAADSHLAVALGIPRKTDTRGGVEEMSIQAASIRGRSDINVLECRSRDEGQTPSRSSALHDAVERIAGTSSGVQRSIGIEAWFVTRNPLRGIKVERLPVALAIGSKQAHAQAEIDRKMIRNAPVILEVGLHNFITVVIFYFLVPLRVTRDVT